MAAATLITVGTAAQAITLVGLTSSNELARFDSANVAAATGVAIPGQRVNARWPDRAWPGLG